MPRYDPTGPQIIISSSQNEGAGHGCPMEAAPLRTAPASDPQAINVSGGSFSASARRVNTQLVATAAAQASAARYIGSTLAGVGRMIKTAPAKPSTIAQPCQEFIRSPRIHPPTARNGTWR